MTIQHLFLSPGGPTVQGVPAANCSSVKDCVTLCAEDQCYAKCYCNCTIDGRCVDCKVHSCAEKLSVI